MENQGYGVIGDFDYDEAYEYNFGYHQNDLRKGRQDRQLQDFQSKLINSSPWTSEEALKKGLEKNINEMGQSFGERGEIEIEKLEKDNKELFKIYNNARDELDDETKKAEFDKNIQKLKDIEKKKYDEYTKLFNSFKGFRPSARSKFTEKIKDAENIFLQSQENLKNLIKESNRAHNKFMEAGFAIRENQSIIEQIRRNINRRYRNLDEYYKRMMNNLTKSKKRKKERRLAKRVMKRLKSKLGGKTKKKRRRRKSTKKKRRRKTKKKRRTRRRTRRGGISNPFRGISNRFRKKKKKEKKKEKKQACGKILKEHVDDIVVQYNANGLIAAIDELLLEDETIKENLKCMSDDANYLQMMNSSYKEYLHLKRMQFLEDENYFLNNPHKLYTVLIGRYFEKRRE